MGLVLEGILNMPYPEDPAEMGVVEWTQAVGGMRNAWAEIERLRNGLEDLIATAPDEATARTASNLLRNLK